MPATARSPDHESDLARKLENERALNAILRCAVSDRDLPSLLASCLDILLGVSWLSIEGKGGIFVADRDQPRLELVAARNFSPEILEACAQVPFGRCLCGRAAATRRLQHARCVDERHEIRYPGMRPHGHYNIPILDGDRTLGVLVLYLPAGHTPQAEEKRFLRGVADVLSLVLRHRLVLDDLRRACARLEWLACTDELTGLANRRHLLQRLQELWSESERTGRSLSLVLCDIDHFKAVNDTYGHHAGDAVLVEFAALLRAESRAYDLAGRFGGEEFALLLPGADAAAARSAAERLRVAVARRAVPVDGEEIRVTASFGVACRRAATDVHDLLRRCDQALYRAKRGGRNRVALA